VIDDAMRFELMALWMPDLVAAFERPQHPDHDALVARVRSSVWDSYAGAAEEDGADASAEGAARDEAWTVMLGCAEWVASDRPALE